jgi:uncharacterized protein HemX
VDVSPDAAASPGIMALINGDDMKKVKWVIWAALALGPGLVYAFGVENIAEQAARKAATGAAKDAVNSVFDDGDGNHKKDKNKSKHGNKSAHSKGKDKSRKKN